MKRQACPLYLIQVSTKNFEGNEVQLNIDYLIDILQPAVQFRDTHNLPILVNQVGARSRCPGHL